MWEERLPKYWIIIHLAKPKKSSYFSFYFLSYFGGVLHANFFLLKKIPIFL